MNNIDRRTLLATGGLAGASLALSGCGGDVASGNASRDEPNDTGRGGDGDEAGPGELWGDTVNKPYPHGGTFTPRYICAAYISFQSNGPIIRQGYVERTTPTQDEARIIELLRTLGHPNVPTIGVMHKRYNFDNFSMKGPHILVVYIDNRPNVARFLTISDIENDSLPEGETRPHSKRLLDHIVRFTRFSGNDRKEVEKNFAFYNIQPIPISVTDMEGPVAYRIDYHNTDELGHEWEVTAGNAATYRRYSMNIHYLARSNHAGGGGTRMIPMVLDPDTGNMGIEP